MSRNGALDVAYALRRNRAAGGGLYRADGGEAEFPAWMNADTLGPLSGPQEEMTRALPDYEKRDPNELAMMRHREMVRPTAGRKDFPMEHVANMATAGLMMTPAGYALVPELALGRAIGVGAQYAPRLTTAGVAAGAALAPSMTEGAENQQAALPKDPQAIKDLQIRLRDAGFPVEVDGIMRPGGPTEKAFKQYQADQAIRRAEELKRQELETQQGANAANLETARANQATAAARLEADRLAAEERARNAERKRLGDERMKEMDKNLSPTSRAIRDYSGPAGMALGALAGAGGRWATKGVNDAYAASRAASGDAIMGENIAAKGAAANLKRVARANDFWREGGAKEVPFLLTPNQAPGFGVNPKASSLSSTYSPNVHPVVEATTTGLPLAESLWADHQKGAEEAELAKAVEDYGTDPSEVNIQRIQKAKDNIALYSGASNLGRVWAGSNLVGAVGGRFMPTNPKLRPGMAPAESEQLALQKILRDTHEKAAKKTAASAPRQIALPPQGGPPLTVDAMRARSTSRKIPEQAHGGGIRSPMDVAYAFRRANRAEGGGVHAGPILSSVPGRTDNHPMDVEEGAYILPADHISSLGEGNTMAGMEVVNHMIESLGADPQHRGDGNPVPINAAGGEVAIPPAAVMAIGGGDIKRGHEMLDDWVLMNRRKHISTLRKLPGPAKS